MHYGIDSDPPRSEDRFSAKWIKSEYKKNIKEFEQEAFKKIEPILQKRKSWFKNFTFFKRKELKKFLELQHKLKPKDFDSIKNIKEWVNGDRHFYSFVFISADTFKNRGTDQIQETTPILVQTYAGNFLILTENYNSARILQKNETMLLRSLIEKNGIQDLHKILIPSKYIENSVDSSSTLKKNFNPYYEGLYDLIDRTTEQRLIPCLIISEEKKEKNIEIPLPYKIFTALAGPFNFAKQKIEKEGSAWQKYRWKSSHKYRKGYVNAIVEDMKLMVEHDLCSGLEGCLENQKEKILETWKKTGNAKYYKDMARNGAWVGDAEISLLSEKYFHLNVKFLAPDNQQMGENKNKMTYSNYQKNSPTVTFQNTGGHWIVARDEKNHKIKQTACKEYHDAMKKLYVGNMFKNKTTNPKEKIKTLEKNHPWLKSWAHKKATCFGEDRLIYAKKKQEIFSCTVKSNTK